MIEQNSRESLDQQEYLNRYNRYAERYDNLKAQIIEYESEKNARKEKGVLISGFMFEVSEFGTAITDFNDQLWMMTVDNVKIYSDGKIIFKFCNGAEIEG